MTSSIARRAAAVTAATAIAGTLALGGSTSASAQTLPDNGCKGSASLMNVVTYVVCQVEYYIAP